MRVGEGRTGAARQIQGLSSNVFVPVCVCGTYVGAGMPL
jgi:hypothetical protein